MRLQPSIRTLVSLWLLGLATLGTAFAQVSIGGSSAVRMTPGETRTLEYTITNQGDSQVEARIFFNDYFQRPTGEMEHVPAESLPQSLFRIAEFGPTEYVLGPGESATVPLVVTLPQQPQAGYWGVIGVEAPPPPSDEEGNAVTFHIRYAMVTVVEVEGLARHQLAIENLSDIRRDDAQAMVLTIRNDGNVYQRFNLMMTFDLADGTTRTVSHSHVVLPGRTIDYGVEVPRDLPAGAYGVFAVLEYENGMRAEAVTTLTVGGE